MPQLDVVDIPKRALFRQPEVCELAKVQPYVLRSWEAEFPDLGVTKTEGGPRLYRRADVERVLQLKHLVYVEGLTLAGARRKLTDDKPDAPVDNVALVDVAELFGAEARDRLLQVKRGLRELSSMLARTPSTSGSEVTTSLAEAPPAADANPPELELAGAPGAAVANSSAFELQVAPARKGSRRKKA